MASPILQNVFAVEPEVEPCYIQVRCNKFFLQQITGILIFQGVVFLNNLIFLQP